MLLSFEHSGLYREMASRVRVLLLAFIGYARGALHSTRHGTFHHQHAVCSLVARNVGTSHNVLLCVRRRLDSRQLALCGQKASCAQSLSSRTVNVRVLLFRLSSTDPLLLVQPACSGDGGLNAALRLKLQHRFPVSWIQVPVGDGRRSAGDEPIFQRTCPVCARRCRRPQRCRVGQPVPAGIWSNRLRSKRT